MNTCHVCFGYFTGEHPYTCPSCLATSRPCALCGKPSGDCQDRNGLLVCVACGGYPPEFPGQPEGEVRDWYHDSTR